MSFCVKQLVEDAEEWRSLIIYESPGMKESCVVNEEASKLADKERVYFHSTVAKLLYLSK
jgi:hypothetical protein